MTNRPLTRRPVSHRPVSHRPVSHRRRAAGSALAACLLLAGAGLGAALGAGADTASAAPSSFPAVPIPLATSTQSSAGTWATLPMGRLDQPLNTFWQLFFRPTGATTWSDKVEATAVATNGGLVLATASGQPFIAAVRPTNRLTFSPLIFTSDGGTSWSNGLLGQGLMARPAALSTAPDGQTLALVDGRPGTQVLVSTGSLSAWRTLATARTLASVNGVRSCGLRSLTAVASLAGDAVVGASCGRPGVVGLFVQRAGTWQRSGPVLPDSLRRGRVEVLTMGESADGGLDALLGITTATGSQLVAGWTGATGQWDLSGALSLAPGQHLSSLGAAAGGSGFFVLSTTSSGARRLAVVGGAGAGSEWRAMPPPPTGTATVAFGPTTASTVEALAAHLSTLTVWSLDSGSGQWVKTQSLPVQIEFGSSS